MLDPAIAGGERLGYFDKIVRYYVLSFVRDEECIYKIMVKEISMSII